MCAILSTKQPLLLYPYAEAGEVPPPPPVDERELTPYSAVVRWNPPADSNGVILSYTVNYVVVSNTSSQDTGRHRRQTSGASVQCILGGEANVNRNMTVDGTQTSATLTGLSKLVTVDVSFRESKKDKPTVPGIWKVLSLIRSWILVYFSFLSKANIKVISASEKLMLLTVTVHPSI